MKKRVAAAVATAGLIVGVTAVPAAADHDGGGCPPRFTAFAPLGDDARADRNGDGLICVKFIRGKGGNSIFFSTVVIDNRVR